MKKAKRAIRTGDSILEVNRRTTRSSLTLSKNIPEVTSIDSDDGDGEGNDEARSISTCADDINDIAEADCIANGTKLIECFICGDQMRKIYELRLHIQQHTEVNSFNEKKLQQSEIYDLLNPNKRDIDTKVIRDFIIEQIKAKRISQFYGILTEADRELHISDSETDTEPEEKEENKERSKEFKDRKVPEFRIDRLYSCNLCQVTFHRHYKALKHQKYSHTSDELGIACDYCGRRYIDLRMLVRHLKMQCECDEYPIACAERFRQHLLKVNLQQFEGLAQARMELRMHRFTTADRVYRCDIRGCEKGFLRSEHLTRHKTVHLPEDQKLKCPVCYKKFNRKDNLRTHMKVHLSEAKGDKSVTADQPILCQYCGHCFTSKSNYVVHMRRHTGEKPYECDVCGKGFAKSSDLSSHKITHSAERNHVCEVCHKAFARASVLSKHRRIHLGPYHCTYCSESFQRPNELANHLRRHAREESLECPVLSSNFKAKVDLEKIKRDMPMSEDAQDDSMMQSLLVANAETVPTSEPPGSENVFVEPPADCLRLDELLQPAVVTGYNLPITLPEFPPAQVYEGE